MTLAINNLHRTRVNLVQTKAAAKRFAKEFGIIDQTSNGYEIRAFNLVEQTMSDDFLTYYTFLLVEDTNTIFAFETGGNGCTASCTAAIEKLFKGVFTNYRPLDSDTKKWNFLLRTRFPKATTKVDISIKLPDNTTIKPTKETNTMTTTKTPRTSTTIEGGLAKRQAELIEVDTDIEAIDTALATLEGGKHVYNAWCDFDETATDRKTNTVLNSKFERTSTMIDELIADLEIQRQLYVDGRKTIERLIEVNTPKAGKTAEAPKPTSGKKADTPKPTAPVKWEDFLKDNGVDFGKLRTNSPEYKKLKAEFDKLNATPAATKPKADPKPNTPPMDADAIKKVTVDTNHRATELCDYLKEEKLRVMDFIPATAKRSATIKLSKQRTIEITREGKAIVVNGEIEKSYSARRFDFVLKAVQG